VLGATISTWRMALRMRLQRMRLLVASLFVRQTCRSKRLPQLCAEGRIRTLTGLNSDRTLLSELC
jgi:hypothetical protein